MDEGEDSQVEPDQAPDINTPAKGVHQPPKKRRNSLSPGSPGGSPGNKGKYTFKRDRRYRDAPGGTRNIQKIYRWDRGQRVSKFRALLPLSQNMEPYILGDFKSMQDALQAADRAVLAYYGRGHPLGVTNMPQELYEVEKLSGHELEDFLLSLEPEGWDRSAAVIDRPAASQEVQGALTGAAELASTSSQEDASEPEAAAAGGSQQGKGMAQSKGRAEASLADAAQHRKRRLKKLMAEQELALNLGSATEAPQATPISSRPVNVFEADRPDEAGADTRMDRSGFAWADPWASRFAEPHDYSADLCHIARCRAAGRAVDVGVREADMTCSRCGMAGHNARNLACPMRAFTGEQTAAPPQPPGPQTAGCPFISIWGALPPTCKCLLRSPHVLLMEFAMQGHHGCAVAEGRCTMRAMCWQSTGFSERSDMLLQALLTAAAIFGRDA